MALICWLGVYLSLDGEESVIDFTVSFSERGTDKRVDASMAVPSARVFINPTLSLADVEENKVVQYKRMYAAINVKVHRKVVVK